MRKNVIKAIVMTVVFVMALIPLNVFAEGIIEFPQGVNNVTARFNVNSMGMPDILFSMTNEERSLIIHVSKDTVIYFEDNIIVYDLMVEGQTLQDVLDGRVLTVSYDVSLRSYPEQTTPVSIMIHYEGIVPLPEDVSNLPHALSFNDVSVDDWFYVPVEWAFTNGIMQGVSATEFKPEATMTRAMLVTVLWRYEGEPKADDSAFTDVEAGSWYSGAVAWAAENGIVLGYDDGAFGVNDPINREQMYTILYRYMNFAEQSIALDEEMRLRQFADEDEISTWAKEAMFYMYDAGVMFRESSMDNNARPQDDAFRGEIAGAMYFYNMYAN